MRLETVTWRISDVYTVSILPGPAHGGDDTTCGSDFVERETLHVASSIELVDSEHAENSSPKQLSDWIRVTEPQPPLAPRLLSPNPHHTLSTDTSHLELHSMDPHRDQNLPLVVDNGTGVSYPVLIDN